MEKGGCYDESSLKHFESATSVLYLLEEVQWTAGYISMKLRNENQAGENRFGSDQPVHVN